jgi:acetyl esterase/lipase
VKRRQLLQSLSCLPVLSSALLATSQGADPKKASTIVYELRVYHAAPGKLGELLARFRHHTTKLFEKHGMKNVMYWIPTDEKLKDTTLIYVISHASMDAAKKSWSDFISDPEWKTVAAESEKDGKILDDVQPPKTPVFLYVAGDDKLSKSSVVYAAAAREAGARADLHIPEKGGHGFGLKDGMPESVRDWPEKLRAFLAEAVLGGSPS